MIEKHKRDLVGLVQLEDLDFADDLTLLLASNHRKMQEKSDRLVKYAKQVELYVSTNKTEAMN